MGGAYGECGLSGCGLWVECMMWAGLVWGSGRSGWGLLGECMKWVGLVRRVHEVGGACEESGRSGQGL